MSKDSWVIGVLTDIRKFANKKGHMRLKEAMDDATNAFLKDLAEQPESTESPDSERDAMRKASAAVKKRLDQ